MLKNSEKVYLFNSGLPKKIKVDFANGQLSEYELQVYRDKKGIYGGFGRTNKYKMTVYIVGVKNAPDTSFFIKEIERKLNKLREGDFDTVKINKIISK